MTDLFEPTITDIFGNNITQSSLFLIVNSPDIYSLLTKISKTKKSSIWKYNRSKIDTLIALRRLDPKNYLILGHVICLTEKPKQLILVHKSLCKNPTHLERITSYGDGSIYKAVCEDQKYISLGLFYFDESSDMITNDESIGIGMVSLSTVVIDKFNTFYDKNSQEYDLIPNDYNLLSSGRIGIVIINKTIYANDDQFKLMNNDGKYITKIDDRLESHPNLNSTNQIITYNTQGELIIDGKCLSFDNKPHPDLFFDTCADSQNQKWNIYSGQISPIQSATSVQSEYKQCITSENNSEDNVSLQTCGRQRDNQIWDTENNDDVSTNNTWSRYKGKAVVLVESDNPWYINKNTTIPIKMQTIPTVLNSVKNKLQADVVSNMILDPTRPNMGLGYSYAERLGIDCQRTDQAEGFDTSEQYINQTNIILCICLIIILLLFYKYLKH